jgi:hypothetical protein
MVNIKMHVFKHPKYYKELRKRNKSDQVISNAEATAASERAPGQGLKLQAASHKHQASSGKLSNQPQASSAKRQASQPE